MAKHGGDDSFGGTVFLGVRSTKTNLSFFKIPYFVI